ncbi:hypothetical protein [Segniliparus rugosus]|uniref:Uncharacterized protein n=1 Tax=Segniliparus rugosus (strain ATCC BAA-974 / DSM 45345 / CCUG 50838 / CIP 108380 / JCM 13579 / CDC 945) TaxID=679197 RepID=E5XS66_SEGRC|nr:hypothetical protein [Segniliparus rugosus]EFV12851.1 hypothetical protein HMPREF9336_02338 [Segniliparus rugosus ATCC BAA-974]
MATETERGSKGDDTASGSAWPNVPPSRPAKSSKAGSSAKGAKAGKPAKDKPASRATTLRSKLMLGAGDRKQKRPGGSSGAKTALIALSLLGNVIALSVIGWFVYAKSLPGKDGSIVGFKLADTRSKVRTKEEQTARDYVSNMMNFDFHHLDSFNAAMSTGISGDLKKTTGPDQLNAIKQLFTTLEAASSFQIVASDLIEDKPDFSVIAVAGHQTLSLKGDKTPRSMSTIIKVTVQKKDQSISALESLDDGRKNPEDQGPPLFPLPKDGSAPKSGQAGPQAPQPKAGQQGQAPKAGQAPQQGQ